MDFNSRNSAMRYPRKRAVTACQLCRARKTKCDNQRPSCRICLSVGAPCEYTDRNDHSSCGYLSPQYADMWWLTIQLRFDAASLEIIDRLNRIQASQQDVLNAVQAKNSGTSLTLSNPHSTSSYTSPQTVSLQDSNATRFSNGDLEVDSFGFPSSYTNPDNVLVWPVFHERYPKNCLQDAVFGPSPQSLQHIQEKSKHIKFGFQEDKVPELMERSFFWCILRIPLWMRRSWRIMHGVLLKRDWVGMKGLVLW